MESALLNVADDSGSGRVATWRYRLRRLLRFGSVELDGFRLLAYGAVPKGLAQQLVRGDYEVPERRAVKAILRPEDRVLEIGACVGVVSLTAARIIGADRVVAYEANPEAAAVARRNYAANGLPVRLIEAAVGKASGTLDLAIGHDNWIGASGRRMLARTLSVPVVPVSQVIADHNPSVLILDVEGMEDEIIPACPFEGVRAIVVEFHPDVLGAREIAQLRDHLAAAGFVRDASSSRMDTDTWLRPGR